MNESNEAIALVIALIALVICCYVFLSIDANSRDAACKTLGYDGRCDDFGFGVNCIRHNGSEIIVSPLKYIDGEWYVDGSNIWHK